MKPILRNRILRVGYWSLIFLISSITCSAFAGGMKELTVSGLENIDDGQAVTVRRCGTTEVRSAVAEQIQKKIAPLLKFRKGRLFTDEVSQVEGFPAGGVIVPVAFHVIHNGQEGRITEYDIDVQMDVLNDAYLGTGIQFVLAVVDYTDNSAWFGIASSSEAMLEAKAALTIDSSRYLNLYFTLLEEGLLGFATFPNDQAEQPDKDGVVLLYTTLPGGLTERFNEGDTAVHEIGHWFGLYHPFQTFIQNVTLPPMRAYANLFLRSGCLGPGDYIDDTPAERSPSGGCNEYRNTCLARPGRDPVRNFMDYSPDSCMDEFTPGQVARMQAMIVSYRPALLETSTATTSLPSGPINTTTTTITLSQGVPVIDSFTVDPEYGYAGNEYTANYFTFSCTAHDPDGYIARYVWDTDGDDVIDEETSSGTLYGYFEESGYYTVQVQVYDNDNNPSDVASVEVEVWEEFF